MNGKLRFAIFVALVLSIVTVSHSYSVSGDQPTIYERANMGRIDPDNLPTPTEVRAIASESTVNWKPYRDSYNCKEFTYALMKDLREAGVYACYTTISFKDSAHAIVSVNTTEGLRYVEPQNDVMMDDLDVGDNYCEKAGNFCRQSWIINTISSCYEFKRGEPSWT